MREIVNGSFEPLWRRNAREDADKFKAELMAAPVSRRKFLAGAGSVLMLEYLAQRRAVAFPLPHGSLSSTTVTGITNGTTGLTYQWLLNALNAMSAGDTILLPAGNTYQYSGTTYYYCDYHNGQYTYGLPGGGSSSGYGGFYLGNTSPYAGASGGDYGSIQGIGTTNNGRASLAPAHGILASDFHTTDTEMFFDSSIPVSVFNPTVGFSGNCGSLGVPGSVSSGLYAGATMTYTGVNTSNNSLTGVAVSGLSTPIPAGTVVSSWLFNGNQGLFVTAGQNPGWTFTNLEMAYTVDPGNNSSSPIRQLTSHPGGPYIGSITVNNCYLHDCNQACGLGYADPTNTLFARYFDTEVVGFGQGNTVDWRGQKHNFYCGHISEFHLDNCYSHNTAGDWLVKSRAALSMYAYCQIRGERTDANPGGVNNDGCDFSNGGLVYIIGNIHQQSLNAANQMFDFCAEVGWRGSLVAGAVNPTQEIYIINSTLIGPANGTGLSSGGAGRCVVRVNQPNIQPPPFTKLSQGGSSSLAARQYFTAASATGTSGETPTSYPFGTIGDGVVFETLSVSANKLLTMQSPPQVTGATGWNCYANYADPIWYMNYTYPQPTSGNLFFWDSGYTQPLFSTTSGGNTISVTGTVTNGSNVVTSVSGLSGLASILQLKNMALYVGGTHAGTSVASVDSVAGTLTLYETFTGTTTTGTLTFGYYLWCGITYQTSLGDSLNLALNDDISIYQKAFVYMYGNPPNVWYDGSYTLVNSPYMFAAAIQVPPGQKLVVNAPPSGPAWASGVNLWAAPMPYISGYGGIQGDASILGMTKFNSSPIAYAGSWTSGANVVAPKSESLQLNYFLQNSSPLSFGTNFVEPSGGLVNHNPTAAKLQWFRRAGVQDGYGGTMDMWYAVVPGGGLSGYSDTIYLNGNTGSYTQTGTISIWRGCATKIFDDNFPRPVVHELVNSTTVSTVAGNVALLSAHRSAGTAGTGLTQISTSTYLNAAYKTSSGALTGQSVTETGGSSSDTMMVDALVGTSSPPKLVSHTDVSGSGISINFTIASANAGDILYLMLGETGLINISAIGSLTGPPPLATAVGVSPVVVIQNCISANFDTVYTGGWTTIPGWAPYSAATLTTNIQANPYNSGTSTFGTPSWATVFADATQSDMDYRLAVSSPAKSSASNPGLSLHGQDLIPHFESNWHGSPTPGTPIPAKASRSDIGPALTGSIGALT